MVGTGVRGGHGPTWPVLLAACLLAVPWVTVLTTVGLAAGLSALLPVLPAPADGVLPPLAVGVVACGCAAAADDATAAVTEAVPVTVRRRLLARVLLVVPLSALGAVGVALGSAWAGATPDPGLAGLWAGTGALGLASGAAARRVADLPAVAAAAVLTGGGLVLVTTVPPEVLEVAAWDSVPERTALALVVAVALLSRVTRDPATRRT